MVNNYFYTINNCNSTYITQHKIIIRKIINNKNIFIVYDIVYPLTCSKTKLQDSLINLLKFTFKNLNNLHKQYCIIIFILSYCKIFKLSFITYTTNF